MSFGDIRRNEECAVCHGAIRLISNQGRYVHLDVVTNHTAVLLLKK